MCKCSKPKKKVIDKNGKTYTVVHSTTTGWLYCRDYKDDEYLLRRKDVKNKLT